MSWIEIGALAALASAIGFGVDKLMLSRQRNWLHDKLLSVWVLIKEANAPDFPRIVASSTCSVVGAAVGKEYRVIKATCFSIATSLVLTWQAVAIGAATMTRGSYWDAALNPYWIHYSWDVIVIMFAINMAFDIPTMLATFYFINKIKATPYRWWSVWVVSDILIALTLAALCLFVIIFYAETRFFLGAYASGYGDLFSSFKETVSAVFIGEIQMTYYKINVAFSMTTLVPTIIYMVFLCVMYVAKIVVNTINIISCLFIERSLEDGRDNLQVFGLTATLFSVLAVAAKTISHFT